MAYYRRRSYRRRPSYGRRRTSYRRPAYRRTYRRRPTYRRTYRRSGGILSKRLGAIKRYMPQALAALGNHAISVRNHYLQTAKGLPVGTTKAERSELFKSMKSVAEQGFLSDVNANAERKATLTRADTAVV